MKKTTAVILTLILLSAAIFTLGSCSGKPKYEFAFITDLHVVANSVFTAENYDYHANRDKMNHISEAVLNSLIDELIEREYKYVFVGGDITEDGDEASHLVCAAAFKRLKDAGIKVYVINGNHDVPSDKSMIDVRISAARFKEIYADFGYADALATGVNNLSYTAEINKNYRLIAIDNMTYYADGDEGTKSEPMSQSHIDWVKAQTEKCAQDKVTPIVITHDSLLNHYPDIAQIALNNATTTQLLRLTSVLADNGCEFIFSGHDHLQDILSYQSAEKNILYEVETGSMIFYPCSYREMSFQSKKVTVSTRAFDNVKEQYLSPHCPQSIKDELNKGYQKYAYAHFYNFLYGMVSNVAKEGGLLSGVSAGEELSAVWEVLMGVVDKAANNPFYLKDEDNNVSLERILNGYGMSIPESGHKNLADLGPYMAAQMFRGDENLEGAPELDLIKYSLFSIFYYLDEAAAEIKTLLPDYPELKLDIEKLFTQDKLESYESNLMPFVLKAVHSVSSTVGNMLGLIESDFSGLENGLIKAFLKSMTQEKIPSFEEFHDLYNLFIGKLIDEAVWEGIAADYVVDTLPSDTFLEVVKTKK